MKTFNYTWHDELYLLHLQFENPTGKPFEARVSRNFSTGTVRHEAVYAVDGMKSHRVMVSRSHPKELAIAIEYPKALTLEVYELDDRAYYPDKPVFKG